MKLKIIATTFIVALVVAGAGYLVACDAKNSMGNQAQAPQGLQAEAAKPGDAPQLFPKEVTKVVALYFHGNMRCATCKKIEALSREAIETGFSGELKSGRLEFQAVNIDLPENEHFVRDFKLTNRSLVIVKVSGGRAEKWENLMRVWEYVGDKVQFIGYVQSETRKFL